MAVVTSTSCRKICILVKLNSIANLAHLFQQSGHSTQLRQGYKICLGTKLCTDMA